MCVGMPSELPEIQIYTSGVAAVAPCFDCFFFQHDWNIGCLPRVTKGVSINRLQQQQLGLDQFQREGAVVYLADSQSDGTGFDS